MKRKRSGLKEEATEELDLSLMRGELGLGALQIEAYANSMPFATRSSEGFWDENIISEKFMLIVCEVAEAMEAYRNTDWDIDKNYLAGGKPEGVGIELADVIIRVADLAEDMGLDLAALVRYKMDYNKTRPIRHGGKRA